MRGFAQVGLQLAAPGFKAVEQRQPAAVAGVGRAQGLQLGEEAGQGHFGQAAVGGKPAAAVIVPARSLGGIQGVGPVAGAVAEQQFGQAGVLEPEIPCAQGRGRGRADFGDPVSSRLMLLGGTL